MPHHQLKTQKGRIQQLQFQGCSPQVLNCTCNKPITSKTGNKPNSARETPIKKEQHMKKYFFWTFGNAMSVRNGKNSLKFQIYYFDLKMYLPCDEISNGHGCEQVSTVHLSQPNWFSKCRNKHSEPSHTSPYYKITLKLNYDY